MDNSYLRNIPSSAIQRMGKIHTAPTTLPSPPKTPQDLRGIAHDTKIKLYSIFRRANFRFYSDKQSTHLLLVLRMSNVNIQSRRSLAFLHCIFFAPIVEDVYPPLSTLDVPLTKKQLAEARTALNALAGLIYFQFAHDPDAGLGLCKSNRLRAHPDAEGCGSIIITLYTHLCTIAVQTSGDRAKVQARGAYDQCAA